MVSSIILSYDNDPVFYMIPHHVAEELKNYHILVVRRIFSSFHNKQHGIILNEDYGMNFPLQTAAFLSIYKDDTFCEDPILLITKENNVNIWKHYISEYTKFSFIPFSDYDVYTTKTRGLIIMGTDVEFKKCVTLKDTDYFMVIVEDLDKVIRMRAMAGLQGEFHVGFTEKNFYKDRDMKLLWQMMRWVEPNKIGKLVEFSEEYNEYLVNMIEPFQEVWFRLTWNFCGSFERPANEEFNLNSSKEKLPRKKSSSIKKRKSDQRSPLNTSTSKKLKSDESNALSSKADNTSLSLTTSYTSIDSSSFSLNVTNSTALSSVTKSRDVSFNTSKDGHFLSSHNNLEQGSNLKKRKSASPYKKTVDCDKISPIKEKYYCSTFKYTPPKKKKRQCNFSTTKSVIDLFEEYYEKNSGTQDSISNDDQPDLESEATADDFSLSLDCSPIIHNEKSKVTTFDENLLYNDDHFSSPSKILLEQQTNLSKNSQQNMVSINGPPNSFSKKNHSNSEYCTSHDDFVFSTHSQISTLFINEIQNNKNVDKNFNTNDSTQESNEIIGNTNLFKSALNDFTKDSEDFNLLTVLNTTNTKITFPSSNINKNDKLIIEETDLNLLKSCNKNRKSVFNSQLSLKVKINDHLSHKEINPLEKPQTNKSSENGKIMPSTSKAGINMNFSHERILLQENISQPKNERKTNPFEDVSSSFSKGTKSNNYTKHKSFCEMSEVITDENVINEFSSDFFVPCVKSQGRIIRKTKSETSLRKIKVIDKHVLEEFAKDFEINVPKKVQTLEDIIFKSVNNFFEGKDNSAPVVSNESESVENIWSLFRKGSKTNENNKTDVDCGNNGIITNEREKKNRMLKKHEGTSNDKTSIAESTIEENKTDQTSEIGQNQIYPLNTNLLNCTVEALKGKCQSDENSQQSNVEEIQKNGAINIIFGQSEKKNQNVVEETQNFSSNNSLNIIEETQISSVRNSVNIIEETQTINARNSVNIIEETQNITAKNQVNLEQVKNLEPSCSNFKSIYSQDTELNDLNNFDSNKKNAQCLICSKGIEVEYCANCNKSVSKVDKSTQSKLEDILDPCENEILKIFNSCDNAESKNDETSSDEKRFEHETNNPRPSLYTFLTDKSFECEETTSKTSLNTFYGDKRTSFRCKEKSSSKDKPCWHNFFGDKTKRFESQKKNSLSRKYSREQILSSIFDDDDKVDIFGSGSVMKNLFNEDDDEDFNNIELWSKSVEEDKSERVRSEILQSLFGD